MKTKLTSFAYLALALTLSFGACIKYVIPTPPPPGGSTIIPPTGNAPYSISMDINGLFSTYNANALIDSSDNGFNIISWGDSACCTNINLAWGVNKFDNSSLTTGIYPSSGFGLENQSEWTIYSWNNWGYTSNVGFLAYPDTVNITNVTDSTITGTFWGTCDARIMSDSVSKFGPVYYDSTITVTNGKFYLRKW